MARTANQQASQVWLVAEAVLAHAPRVLLWGPAGTGKTMAATRVGLRPGQKVFNVTLTDDLPAAELRGHYLPQGKVFVWHDGPAVTCWRLGARLVLNEIDRAGGDALTFLMAILDDPQMAMLTLPTGESVRPAAGFSVVGTMNGDPSDLPPALADRFPATLEIDTVHPEALARLPHDLRGAAVGTSFTDESERRVSIRVWAEFARLREVFGEDMAARACFGHRAQEVLTALRVARG
jgi:MoxR-like ATPase